MRRIGHDERMALAWRAVTLLRRRYGRRLVAVGLYGSTARCEDGPYSDVELTAVVKGRKVDEKHEGIVRGLKYTIDVTTVDVVRREMTALHAGWPLFSSIYVVGVPIHDPAGLYPALRRLYDRTRRGNFRPVLRREVTDRYYEIFSKFSTAVARGDPREIRYLAFYVSYSLKTFWGLVNRRHLGGATYRPDRLLALPRTPPSYRRLGGMILAGDLRDTKQVARTVLAVRRDVVRLAGAAPALRGSPRLTLGRAIAYG